jgi:hypothetical protein
VRSLAPILGRLAEAQSEFFRAADVVPADQWSVRPSSREWSTAEVVAHLVMIERAIIGGADRATRKAPRKISLLKRMHLPLWLVESRIVRRKTPIPLDPAMISDKEQMLGELRAARDRTLAFLEETKGRNLSGYNWPHPFIGMLNLYEWFEMIAAHQLRHTKQVKEISARLPKVV